MKNLLFIIGILIIQVIPCSSQSNQILDLPLP